MLTATQIVAIVMLLQAFGLAPSAVANVQALLLAGNSRHAAAQGSATAAGATTPVTSTPQSPDAPAVVIAPSQGAQPSQASAYPTPANIVVFNSGYYLDNIQAPHYAAPDGTTLDSAKDGEFVTVGAIVYDSTGLVDCAAVVTATTSDSSQNKTWTSTPYRDQDGRCYYQYQYLFKWAGTHTVEFDAQDAKQVLTLSAQ